MFVLSQSESCIHTHCDEQLNCVHELPSSTHHDVCVHTIAAPHASTIDPQVHVQFCDAVSIVAVTDPPHVPQASSVAVPPYVHAQSCVQSLLGSVSQTLHASMTAFHHISHAQSRPAQLQSDWIVSVAVPALLSSQLAQIHHTLAHATGVPAQTHGFALPYISFVVNGSQSSQVFHSNGQRSTAFISSKYANESVAGAYTLAFDHP